MTDTLLEGPFRTFFDTWASFRLEGQLVPDWERIKPMAFGALLPEVSLVQKHGDKDYRYRLLGSGINQRIGADPVGVDILSFLPQDLRANVAAWLERMANHPCAALHEASVEFEKIDGRAYRGLNLPIRGRGGEIDTFIYYNQVWDQELGEVPGALLSVGKKHFSVRLVDIGAGLPVEQPVF